MSVVLLEIKDSVGWITLNRPDKLNSFNREMSLMLQDKLDECAANDLVRSVYLTGAGKGFSAGQDLAEVADPRGSGLKKILSEQLNPVVVKIRNLQKPVVAAVNGVAAGAGANIALCCDVVVASAAASFVQAFSKIGLIPDCGGTFNLPRLIGWQKASAMMMLGDKIDGEEAEKIGMIYKVFAVEDFAAESMKMAKVLATMPTKGLALTKQALQLSAVNNLEQQLHIEDTLQAIAGSTHDFAEGVSAFIQKRTPDFKGR